MLEISNDKVLLDMACSELKYENVCIETLDAHDLNYIDFFENFMLKNVPCIIKNISSDWEATEKWVVNETINYEYFENKYGDLEAPVANCNNVEYNAHCKTDMKVRDYMNYLKSCTKTDQLYLKDWHLKRQCPGDRFYKVPIFFASDWLNEFAVDKKEDDFMFVYIGPNKTWTPIHADVYNSFSWSVNVIGRKEWILFPPGEEEKIKDLLGNLPLSFDADKNSHVQHFIVTQHKGDAIFVPSGWYHQVTNTLDTISINHNWLNACNLYKVWKALQSSLISVENEIQEIKDTPEFSSQCQLILKSIFGMDFQNFVEFICYIAQKRLKQLEEENQSQLHGFSFGIKHIKFDLDIILDVINSLQNHTLINKRILSDVNYQLLTNIQNILMVTMK